MFLGLVLQSFCFGQNWNASSLLVPSKEENSASYLDSRDEENSRVSSYNDDEISLLREQLGNLLARMEEKDAAIEKLTTDLGYLKERFETEKSMMSILQNNFDDLQTTIAEKLVNSDVLFSAASKSGSYKIPDSFITFETNLVDTTGSFDKETGIFKAPIDGVYAFFFNCEIDEGMEATVKVFINGEYDQEFNQYQFGSQENVDRQFSVFWSMQLKQNDEIRLENEFQNTLYVSSQRGMYFWGYKMN